MGTVNIRHSNVACYTREEYAPTYLSSVELIVRSHLVPFLGISPAHDRQNFCSIRPAQLNYDGCYT